MTRLIEINKKDIVLIAESMETDRKIEIKLTPTGIVPPLIDMFQAHNLRELCMFKKLGCKKRVNFIVL